MVARCTWADGGDDLLTRYHDEEWGVPRHDEQHLFEMLILEGAQAGLSWLTILKRRETYRAAFADFDPATIAGYGEADRERLLGDTGIIRNRAKVGAAIGNAQAWCAMRDEGIDVPEFLWGFVDGEPRQYRWETLDQIPVETPESNAMSKELKRLGFRFVGPTICNAYMEAVGMRNDHEMRCFRWRELGGS